VYLRRGEYRVAITENGKRIVLADRFPNTPEGLQAAEDVRDEVRIARNRGTWESPTQVTVADFVPAFLDAKRMQVRPNTLSEYARATKRHIVPRLGSTKLNELTATRVRRFYAQLLDSGLSPKTVRNVASTLRQLLQVAVTDRVIAANPSIGVELPRVTKPPIEVWTPEQTRHFISTVPAPLSTIVVVMATTGMRRSEVLGLTWPAIDFDKATLSVTATVVNVDNVPVFRPMEGKTAGSLRTIALDGYTIEQLRLHKTQQAKQRLLVGSLWRTDQPEFVFSDEVGCMYHPNKLTRQFQKAAIDAELPAIGTKGLRHSFATTALTLGTHPKVVQERLGHSTITTTLDRYSHVLPEQDREAAVRVAEAIAGGE
jgi:integrase